jgi:hypothetical protein
MTGGLSTSRVEHTTTGLADGRVLVAGGLTDPLSAEIYDPATGVWTSTGSMNVRRWLHTATLLSDGKVLAAGGYLSADGTCELYDPATGTWTLTGSMSIDRNEHTAVLQYDGTVLVAGDPNSSSSELYDPVTGTWSSAGDLKDQRTLHTMTRLRDGTTLVAGGNKFPTIALNSAEIYTPASIEPMNVNGIGTFNSSAGTATFRMDVTGTHGMPTGDLTYSDPDANVTFGRVGLRKLTISGNTATITGSVTLDNGTGKVAFTATAVDNSANGSTDTLSITLNNGYSASGTLTSGNINIQ